MLRWWWRCYKSSKLWIVIISEWRWHDNANQSYHVTSWLITQIVTIRIFSALRNKKDIWHLGLKQANIQSVTYYLYYNGLGEKCREVLELVSRLSVNLIAWIAMMGKTSDWSTAYIWYVLYTYTIQTLLPSTRNVWAQIQFLFEELFFLWSLLVRSGSPIVIIKTKLTELFQGRHVCRNPNSFIIFNEQKMGKLFIFFRGRKKSFRKFKKFENAHKSPFFPR